MHLCSGGSRRDRVCERRAVNEHDRGRIAEGGGNRERGAKAVGPGIAGDVIAQRGELRLIEFGTLAVPPSRYTAPPAGSTRRISFLVTDGNVAPEVSSSGAFLARREGDANEGVGE